LAEKQTFFVLIEMRKFSHQKSLKPAKIEVGNAEVLVRVVEYKHGAEIVKIIIPVLMGYVIIYVVQTVQNGCLSRGAAL